MDRVQYGPWAVIAGGSEGLGAAFADRLAHDGFNLILIGRKVEPLEETAAKARAAGIEVRTLALDLSAADLLPEIRAATDDVEVGLLIYNAGANGYGSHFVDGDLERFSTVIDVNTRGRLSLCHQFGAKMKQRQRGGMILVGSLAGYRGSPHNALYNAAKAFTRIFAEGLWFELKPFHVDVVEFVVGGMRTPAMARRGMQFGPETAEPDQIAAEGLEHIGDGPVWNSEAAGGVEQAEHLNSFPRQPIIEEAAEGLTRIGLYP